MLIIGLLLAGVGVAAWRYGANPQPTFYGIPFYWTGEWAERLAPAGLGILAIGGGLAIGGIIRMTKKPKKGKRKYASKAGKKA